MCVSVCKCVRARVRACSRVCLPACALSPGRTFERIRAINIHGIRRYLCIGFVLVTMRSICSYAQQFVANFVQYS